MKILEMERWLLSLAVGLAILVPSAAPATSGASHEHRTLEIGAPLPRFSLKGVDGKIHGSEEYAKSPVLVVMFVSNHCPTSQLYETRMKKLHETYASKGVTFIAIQSNGPKAVAPSELGFTDLDDTYDSMVIRADYRQFKFPYLYDGDEQSTAEAFGPKATPHIFIFDRERKLRFEGRIDNHMQEGKATSHDTRDALDALIAGHPVKVTHTAVFGCSIKWNSKIASAEREIKDWQAQPVNVETVTLKGLKELRANPTGKLLMINFWATWCGPCKSEYPDLLTTYQWYRSRDLEFVSVSVDNPAARTQVQKFLQQAHSPIRNLQVDSDDLYGIQAAFDPAWQSGVPFTMVLSPDGKVVFRQEGEVDILKLRRVILAHLGDSGYPGIAAYWKQQ
jgi:thiol-disulfide isomerase/thioredoxin